MAQQPGAPVLVKAIPSQIVNEGATFGPLNLDDFIQSSSEMSGAIQFQAELANGDPLVKGLICTRDGMLSGIPAVGTQGNYDVIIIAKNDAPTPFTTKFSLTIKERAAMDTDMFGGYKTKVWEALIKNLPIPDMGELLNRPVSAVELYYLLQRFGVLTVWDVYNLEMPTGKKLLQLEGMSKHYNVYDRGSCIVGAPKDLFSYERTLEDALQTSRAIAREVYKRNWTVELSGFNKMIRGAWVELQLLGDKNGKHLDVLHFSPSADDLRIYAEKARAVAAASLGM